MSEQCSSHKGAQGARKTEVDTMLPELFYDEVLEKGRSLLLGEEKLSDRAAEFLDQVISFLRESEVELDTDDGFIRAQKGGDLVENCWLDENQEISGIRAFQEVRMIPDLSFCGEGRFHRKGEAGFYFAAEVDTAVKEMRPRRGLEFSIAYFSPKRKLKLVHVAPSEWSLSDRMSEAMGGKLSTEKMEAKVKAFIYRLCSDPTSELLKNEYVPTQLIAERLRDEGYDGIVYDSAMSSKTAGVLFCPPNQDPQHYFPQVVKFNGCRMKKVKYIKVVFDDEHEKSPDVLIHDEKCTLKDENIESA
jgi:hypothetical protein